MKLVVFDFDGTLADTIEEYMVICNDILEEMGYPRLSAEKIEELRHVGPKEALKIINFPKHKLPFLLRRSRDLLQQHYPELKAYPGIVDELKKLKKQGAVMGILTSNSLENVEPFLTQQNLRQYFTFIHCKSSFFGKKRHLKKILKTQKANPRECVFIGDEVRDVEAARGAGAHVIAVTWGATGRAPLVAAQPEAIIERVDEISESVDRLLT